MTTHNADSAAALEVELVPILQDNYAYVITDVETGTVGVVDPGEASAIEAALRDMDLTPDWILLTHHHHDHINGAARLAESYGAKIAGAKADAARLPKLDAALIAGEDWSFGAQIVEIIDTPGHTVGHIAYHFEGAKVLFSGDTLFAMGCGRLFEGTALQMWQSLRKLAALPPETSVYCGHEYTLSNAAFAKTIEPNNPALIDRVAEVEALRGEGLPTIPTTIGRELATNPFIRAFEPAVKNALNLPGADDAAVFAQIRRRKDEA
ncbi:MAG: hydroxyacylglutathione hydrolase [Neomegalonema sp.]|nr:hydroxyacylglutathione hydrolase [Neomegalonema sp.]